MIFFAFLWSTSFLKKIIEGTAEITEEWGISGSFLGLTDFRMDMWGKSVL